MSNGSSNNNTSTSPSVPTWAPPPLKTISSVVARGAEEVAIIPPDPLNIKGMVREQREKHLNKYLRMRLVAPGIATFQAKIDPQDFSRQQAKRSVQLDVLTGVVIQDFGYKPEILEIKGTTGARYWTDFNEMDLVFKGQANGKPVPITLYIERHTYTGFWTQFSANRTINAQAGNLVQYSMQFVVFASAYVKTADAVAAGASLVSQLASSQAPGSIGSIQLVQWSGSVQDYVSRNVPDQPDDAMNFIENYWNYYTSNGAYPGPDKPLKSTQFIPVPNSWSAYLAQFSVAVNY